MTTIDTVLAQAHAEVGKRYVYGAVGPGTFDCSGLMLYIFGLAGVTLPRTAHEQQAYTTPVSRPLPGDLVFYGAPAHHVGLYLGAGQMIDAPGDGLTVRVEGVGSPTGYGRVPGAGTLAAPVIGVATTAAALGGNVVGWLLGGVRAIVIEGLAVTLGLALLGYGIYRTTKNPGGNP